MTDNERNQCSYLPVAAPPQRGESLPPASADGPGTADVVRDQASDLRQSGVQAGKHVADVAREQASGVAAEAGRQGEDLLGQAQGQPVEQAARGQQQLADRLFSLSDELCSIAGASGQGGMAAGVASQAASRVRAAAQWLEERKPGQVADGVQSFVRTRPAVFLVLAAGAGLVAGRLTRGLKGADTEPGARHPAGEGRWSLMTMRAVRTRREQPARSAAGEMAPPGDRQPASGRPDRGPESEPRRE